MSDVEVLVAWCAECVRDGAGRPERLGTVRLMESGVRLWSVEERRLARKHRITGTKEVAAVVLSHPLRSSVPDPPDELPAACEKHKWGVVSTAEILAALAAGSGNIVLKIRATA